MAFFVAVFAMPVYGGEAYDKNGYLPFAAPVPVIAKRWDVNITIFCVLAVLLVVSFALDLGRRRRLILLIRNLWRRY